MKVTLAAVFLALTIPVAYAQTASPSTPRSP